MSTECYYLQLYTDRAAEKNEMALHLSCLRCPTPECGVRSSVSSEEENFSGVADAI